MKIAILYVTLASLFLIVFTKLGNDRSFSRFAESIGNESNITYLIIIR